MTKSKTTEMQPVRSLLEGLLPPDLRRPEPTAAVTVKKRHSTPSSSALKLLNAAAEVRTNPDAVERAYMARQLVQCTLPHSNPKGNPPIWSRRNGNVSLAIQPDYDEESKKHLYPYGALPRLIMIWICSEATIKKSRHLTLGKSFSDFMRTLGLNPSNGGQRSDAVRLRDQLTRLLHSRIRFQQHTTTSLGQRNSNLYLEVSSADELWWSNSHQQESLFESWIELGEKFYEAVIAAPVPLDMRALKGLTKSPLALDLYTLIAYRTHGVNKIGSAQTIPWEGLRRQLGAAELKTPQLRQRIEATLRKVRDVYPTMKVRVVKEGLRVSPAPTPIPPALPTS